MKELFLEVLNKHAPLQHKKTKSSKVPWITNKVKCLITTRNKLKRKAIITKTETDWSNYKKIRNQVNVDLTPQLTADIEKAFLMVDISESDRDMLRIFWFD